MDVNRVLPDNSSSLNKHFSVDHVPLDDLQTNLEWNDAKDARETLPLYLKDLQNAPHHAGEDVHNARLVSGWTKTAASAKSALQA